MEIRLKGWATNGSGSDTKIFKRFLFQLAATLRGSRPGCNPHHRSL